MTNTGVGVYLNYFTRIGSIHHVEWLGPWSQLLLTLKRHCIYFSITFTQMYVCVCQLSHSFLLNLAESSLACSDFSGYSWYSGLLDCQSLKDRNN